MTFIPHFALPFSLTANGGVAVTQQDSIDDISQCVEMALGCTQGTRLVVPDFGVTDPTFTDVSPGTLEQQVKVYEPRAELAITVSWPSGTTEASVTCLVSPIAHPNGTA